MSLLDLKREIFGTRGRLAFVIPVFNHAATAAKVIERTAAMGRPVIVVDDGSTDDPFRSIAGREGVTIIRHEINKGKGAALRTGLEAAAAVADWAITLDSDGQHEPADAHKLIAAVPPGERPIVIGRRVGMVAGPVPWTSRFGRKFSNFWVRTAGGPKVTDSQSGFRLYPLPEVLRLKAVGDRFQYEVEILALAGWAGMRVIEAPVSVDYRPEGKRISHFRPFVDFWRDFFTFTRLITLRVILPLRLRARWFLRP